MYWVMQDFYHQQKDNPTGPPLGVQNGFALARLRELALGP